MKRISSNREEWLSRRQRVAFLTSRRQSGIKKSFKVRTGHRLGRSSPIAVIRVPPRLVAETEEERSAILQCVYGALDLLNAGKRVRFDFTRTVKAFPGGLLVLLAYIELMLEIFPSKITASVPHGSLISQLLQHFGFAQKLGCTGTAATHESVVKWKFLTGTQADGVKISELLATYKAVSDAEIPLGLYDVLAEALTNVRHHAYPEGKSDTPERLRKWWLFSRYEIPTRDKPGRLFLAVYDLGVGIQQSLRAKLNTGEIVLDAADGLFRLIKLGDTLNIERVLLKRAVEEERSQTGLSFRGNGLPEMKDFVMGTTSGRMYIISGSGQYTCSSADGLSEAFGCKMALPGTLILWSIPLGAKSKD